MSVRHSTAPPTPRMIDLPKDRLYHVLSVGTSVTAEVELTDEDFEAAVHHYVEEVGTGMSVVARKAMMDSALRLARAKAEQGTEYVTGKAKQASAAAAEKAQQAAKKTSRYMAKKSKKLAKQVVNEVKRQQKGAYRPALWHQLSVTDFTKRICTDYKRHIEQEGWDKMKAVPANANSLQNVRVVYADTGSNAHARIEITSTNVKVAIASNLASTRTQEVSKTREFGATTSFDQFKKITDELVRDVVEQFLGQLRELLLGVPRS